MAVNLPTIIQGPALVQWDSVTFHVQSDVTVDYQTEGWNPQTAWGPIGERLRSRVARVTFTPVGEFSAVVLNKLYASFLTPTDMGESIFPTSPGLVIASLVQEKTFTFPKAGLTRAPTLTLSPTATAFGPAEFTCIGKSSTAPTGADYWKAEGALGSYTNFDETDILIDIWSGALGARSSPYAAMGSMNGFMIEPTLETQSIPAGDVGVGDIVKSGVSLAVRFAPSNMTEAQVDTLLAVQDAVAVLPGQEFAKGNEDLVLTGNTSGSTFTAKQVGAKDCGFTYAVGAHRFREISFSNGRRWTGGVPQALLAHSIT